MQRASCTMRRIFRHWETARCLLISSGSLMIAVSTAGQSPAFAKYIKNWLEESIPEDFGAWLDRLSALRGEAKGKIRTSAERERFWRAAFSSDVMALAASGHLEEAEEYIRNAMGGFGAES